MPELDLEISVTGRLQSDGLLTGVAGGDGVVDENGGLGERAPAEDIDQAARRLAARLLEEGVHRGMGLQGRVTARRVEALTGRLDAGLHETDVGGEAAAERAVQMGGLDPIGGAEQGVSPCGLIGGRGVLRAVGAGDDDAAGIELIGEKEIGRHRRDVIGRGRRG